jgi:hypothetical protein
VNDLTPNKSKQEMDESQFRKKKSVEERWESFACGEMQAPFESVLMRFGRRATIPFLRLISHLESRWEELKMLAEISDWENVPGLMDAVRKEKEIFRKTLEKMKWVWERGDVRMVQEESRKLFDRYAGKVSGRQIAQEFWQESPDGEVKKWFGISKSEWVIFQMKELEAELLLHDEHGNGEARKNSAKRGAL